MWMGACCLLAYGSSGCARAMDSHFILHTCPTHPPQAAEGFRFTQDPAKQAVLHQVLGQMGLRKLTSVRVVHCPHAFAIVLESDKVREGEGERDRERERERDGVAAADSRVSWELEFRERERGGSVLVVDSFVVASDLCSHCSR